MNSLTVNKAGDLKIGRRKCKSYRKADVVATGKKHGVPTDKKTIPQICAALKRKLNSPSPARPNTTLANIMRNMKPNLAVNNRGTLRINKRMCMSYKKPELVSIVKKYGLPTANMTKKRLCNSLKGMANGGAMVFKNNPMFMMNNNSTVMNNPMFNNRSPRRVPLPNSPGMNLRSPRMVPLPNSPGLNLRSPRRVPLPNSPGLNLRSPRMVPLPNSPGLNLRSPRRVPLPNSPGTNLRSPSRKTN